MTASAVIELRVDSSRIGVTETGIYVRAKHDDKWGSHDIAELDRDSLRAWLRSRGGDNPWAESVVEALLGHGPS